MLVQGPPGAGKTYLSAPPSLRSLSPDDAWDCGHSHKAINRLLEEVSDSRESCEVQFRAVKKCSKDEDECSVSGVTNVYKPDEVTPAYNLVAGTAWLFARPDTIRRSTPSLSMRPVRFPWVTSSQLASAPNHGASRRSNAAVQPIQGAHPGESGHSALQFLLKDHATVPSERGVFLDVTRRMHPDVCRFISEAVYEGRLHADPSCAARRLVSWRRRRFGAESRLAFMGPGGAPGVSPKE